ncbi:bifunctional biotin--[acetyl-CoA-carboxylase] ligase/biotin operon repressor BirA [uncultured Amphritea sp.]|uniref:bifunctional biotin--[acetyl-CoA-carboxylase] ligase/biotin operon repressor BirA n=1 Tax=uncultured Amphritea sp. TaxID=981605 RepID=UPI002615226B|nr:bifunctional biotin--[acetyl-CoA-carboxylase] ligase/biotin operon repressor BirA [uncultured Amphritea sp.]
MKKTQTCYKLLELLRDGQFHSGETLGNALGISRSAICKAAKQLHDYGIAIEPIHGRGYRIPYSIELLNQHTIEQQLDNTAKDRLDDLIILHTTHSTNDYLLDLKNSQPNQNIACFAEYQSNGKGRRGRQWLAPFGTNIYHSLLWHFKKDPAEIVGLSLAIALAAVNALKRYGIVDDIAVKWPNDILWQGRKLGGVLLEMVAEHHGYCALVIGIGLNTHIANKFAHCIDQPWVDIQHITQSQPRRNQLAGLLLNETIHTLIAFEQQGLQPFLDAWQPLDYMLGKMVTLYTANGNINGVMNGISDKGELVLLCENNQQKRFFNGELSVRLAKEKPAAC